MAKRFSIHWLAPTLMLGSLLVGVMFAIGHHLFYWSLVGRQAATDGYTILGSKYSGQQFNIAVGTALGFLVKSCLVLSVSTAFCQVFWRMAKGRSQIKMPAKLERIDAIYGATTNPFTFLNVFLWYHYPVLILTAAIIWLIPIASIITPATLSVSLTQAPPNVTLQRVPTIDFANLNFVAGMPSTIGFNSESLYYLYNGPSQITKQIAMAVAAQNAILPVPAPSLNSSWELKFRGPSLKCNDMPPSKNVAIQKNIAQYLLQDGMSCEAPAAYLAWYGHLDPNITLNVTYFDPYLPASTTNLSNLTTFATPDSIFDLGVGDLRTGGLEVVPQDASFNIAVLPHMFDLFEFALSTVAKACFLSTNGIPYGKIIPLGADNLLGPVGGDITMLQCRLYNTTYLTRFTFVNGTQAVDIQMPEPESDVPVSILNLVRGPGSDGYGNNASCTTLNTSGDKDGDGQGRFCDYDSDLVPQLAYQGVLQAFTTLITGNVSLGYAGAAFEGAATLGAYDYTNIRSTGLVYTKELAFLTDYALHKSSTSGNPDLQNALLNSSMPEISGMSRLSGAQTQLALKDAIEAMFQNITISLMSSAVFQPDYTTSSGPPEVSVTSVVYQTVYVYAEYKLWIAYGIATLLTVVAVILGMTSMIINGASFSNKFSSVLLASRKAELSVEVRECDTHGNDPLPAYLGSATVTLSQAEPLEMRALRMKGGGEVEYRSLGQLD